ncbi:hypothetical protein LX64_00323 [Chitinophaga skermanii]|uniref:Uncharacterized protein n=1 Tax=Chitinophaga skermanii TaxID=331697 RepID=A0A327R9X3_9BACT|nr:hypothetical protein [Chitinophaga skermanii]RAJ10717.1 hypothetical protein LX64_00323 [Chitinophaga skermanii]
MKIQLYLIATLVGITIQNQNDEKILEDCYTLIQIPTIPPPTGYSNISQTLEYDITHFPYGSPINKIGNFTSSSQYPILDSEYCIGQGVFCCAQKTYIPSINAFIVTTVYQKVYL